MKLRNAGAIAACLGVVPVAGFAERGGDGHLNVLYWQAPSTLNPYMSAGTKDVEAASLVLEPLARLDQDGELVPFLAQEIPTLENGGISDDLTTVRWRLRDGLLWSDGSPVTAEDAVFTWQYCTAPETGCAQSNSYGDIVSVTAPDARTIEIVFSLPKPYPYTAFVGVDAPILQKAQFEGCIGARAQSCVDQNFAPIGTGPFVVQDFLTNDVATFVANPNYREADKPAFATLTLKGGGDAAAAARAVLLTGEFDYAWNLQLEPDVLEPMAEAGIGEVVSAFGPSVEGILVNLTDPDPTHGDLRSTYDAGPHPILSEPDVVRALSLAIDRQAIDDVAYGAAGRPACNMLQAPGRFASDANDWCLRPDLPEARRLLNMAGWVPGPDGIRVRDGRRLSLVLTTTTNTVRQTTQAILKQAWEEIGVETELRAVPASVFFGGDQSSPDTYQKFYADLAMYAILFDGVDPERTLSQWRCSDIPAPKNNWSGRNASRLCDPDYDKLVAELSATAEPDQRAALAKRMNDMMIDAGVAIPLIHRGTVSAHARSLAGVRINPWDSELWNIADWHRVQ